MKYAFIIITNLLLTKCAYMSTGSDLNQVTAQSNIGYLGSSAIAETFTERVTFSSKDKNVEKKLSDFINLHSPTMAELSCDQDTSVCKKVKRILSAFSIPVKFTPCNDDSNSDIAIIYEKLGTHDCYSDLKELKVQGEYVAYPPLGCATMSNFLEMISDPRQIVHPKLSAMQDAKTAVKNLNKAL